jgi:phosphate transport system substrate-binding protein
LRKFTTAVAALALLSTIALSGPANAAETITGEGSSFAYGRISACAASYTTDTVTYASTGSGNGKKSFNGVSAVQRDFAGSDAVYGGSDVVPKKSFVYVPVTGGAIALAYNVGGVNKLQLDPEVIQGIFSGKITKWNDAKIAKINPSVKLPAKGITVGYREGSSGTTQNFVDYLIQSKKAATWKLNGTFESAAPSLPALKFTAANSQVMASKIDATGYSIGYVDLFDTIDNDLQYASVKNIYTAKVKGKNKLVSQYVAPTSASAGLFLNAQTKNMAADGSIKIDFSVRIKNAYPMSLFTYVIAPAESAASAAKGAAVKKFVNYVVNSCKATPGYATFPSTFKKLVTTKLIAKIG